MKLFNIILIIALIINASVIVQSFSVRDILNFHPWKKPTNNINQKEFLNPQKEKQREISSLFEDLTKEETGVVCEACEWIVKEIAQLIDQNQGSIVSTVSAQCALLESQPFISVCQAIVNKFGNDIIDEVTENLTPEEVCRDLKLCCDDSSSSEEPSSTTTTPSTTTITTTGEPTTTSGSPTTGEPTTTSGSPTTTTTTSTTTITPISSGSTNPSTGSPVTSGGHTSATGGLYVDHEGNPLEEW